MKISTKMKDVDGYMNAEQEIAALSLKLDAFAKLLNLHPYDEHGHLQKKLQLISHKLIQPVYVLCPKSMECETVNCNSRALHQKTPTWDIPQVTLIKNSVIHNNVFVLTGECSNCKTKYSADHEQAIEVGETNQYNRVYLNSAQYLKIGQSVWVDWVFFHGVLNSICICRVLE